MKKYFSDNRDRFFDNRLGLFVHWGIYSVGAWHEQHGYRANISQSEYAKYAESFNPVDYNPAKWLDMVQKNGYDYICFTTKHIDGFCMFDTKLTDFSIMNTPYGRDILKELSDECHKRNFPLALYYSPIDRSHLSYPQYGGAYENKVQGPEDNPDMQTYMDFLKGQVEELCSNYGKIYAFWWDGGNVVKYEDASINEMIRELQPGILINNRGFSEGDFRTPERDWYKFVDSDASFETPTEACQSIGTESWGYRVDEEYYSIRYLMKSMDKILAKGGNYLLNAGPMANGKFPKEALHILEEIGGWYNNIKDAIYNTEPVAGVIENNDVLLTAKNNTLYVHIYKHPKSSVVWLGPLDVLPISAKLLNSGKPVEVKVELTPLYFKEGKPLLRISNLPVNDFSGEVMVIAIKFNNLKEALKQNQ